MAEPIPPETSRADAFGRLQRERWIAENAGETGLVAEFDRRIARLSAASSPTPPARETTADAPTGETAAKKTAARKTASRTPTTKGKPRVRSPR